MLPPAEHTLSRAFSLVELSIVLVILGLLVGGVLSGRSLIRASELRSVTAQNQTFKTAVHSFRDKYFQLPGDMPNATQFWGAQDPTPATCNATPSTTKLTCNGNGNGEVRGYPENSRFWQHLANANLIEGSYNGTDSAPPSKLKGADWSTEFYGTLNFPTNPNTEFNGEYGHGFLVGDFPADMNTFRSSELWNIDTKVDDGKPATGKVVAGPSLSTGWTGCISAVDNNDMNATYIFTSDEKCLSAYFREQY